MLAGIYADYIAISREMWARIQDQTGGAGSAGFCASISRLPFEDAKCGFRS